MLPVIRLVATDIDGTLAAPDSQLTPRTLRVLQAVHDRGTEVALVTGLNPWVAKRYVATIGPWAHAICLNGIFTLRDGEAVPGKVIDPNVARRAATVMHSLGYVPMVFGEDLVARYLPTHTDGLVEVNKLVAERPFQPYRPVKSFTDLFAARPVQVAVCDSEVRAAPLYPRLIAALGKDAYVVLQPGARSWVEVSHPEARKDLGLLALCDRLGIAPGETLYFGDSLNDLPVFQAFPCPIAMTNAHPEIKALAWRMAPTNAEDGVAAFLSRHFELSA